MTNNGGSALTWKQESGQTWHVYVGWAAFLKILRRICNLCQMGRVVEKVMTWHWGRGWAWGIWLTNLLVVTDMSIDGCGALLMVWGRLNISADVCMAGMCVYYMEGKPQVAMETSSQWPSFILLAKQYVQCLGIIVCIIIQGVEHVTAVSKLKLLPSISELMRLWSVFLCIYWLWGGRTVTMSCDVCVGWKLSDQAGI